MKPEDPALDLSLYTFPVGGEEIFGNGRPVALEIGFGEGEFLINEARENESRNYLGVEIKGGRFRKAVGAAKKLCRGNARFAHIEAEIALAQVFRENTFDLVFINFPDPWPKKKHSKHRMFNRRFIGLLSGALAAGGKTVVKTDQLPYMEEIAREFCASGLFRSACPPPGFTEVSGGEAKTKFEKLFRENSERIFTATFVSPARRTGRGLPVPEAAIDINSPLCIK